MRVRLESVRLNGVEDGEGLLAYCDDTLVAVFVRLGADQGEYAGAWFVEKGFGFLDRPQHPLFETAEAAEAWLRSELADRAGGPTPV